MFEDVQSINEFATESVRCLRCNGRFVLRFGGELTCRDCGSKGKLDEFGIVSLVDKQFYYREMPRHDLCEILQGETKREILTRFDQFVLSKGFEYASYIKSYALDARRAAGVFLLDINEDSMVLDFGSGWGTLTRVLSEICKQVVSVDLTYESLLFSARISNKSNVKYVHAGSEIHLPFKSDLFDAVILNGVLEWIPEGACLDENPRVVQQQFLQEVYRILRPDGQVYIGIENRFGAKYFLGVREDHTGLRYGALLPRWLSNMYSILARRQPYRTFTYGYGEYQRLMQDAGFDSLIFHPWPDYRRFTRIFTSKSINHFRLSNYADRICEHKVAGSMLSILAQASKLQWFTPAFSIVGTKGAQGASSNILLGILKGDEDSLDNCTIVISSTQTILVHTTDYFYKIPLTHEARQRILCANEARNILRHRFPQLAKFAVIEGELTQVGAVVYTREPLLGAISADYPGAQDFFRLYLNAVSYYENPGYLDLLARLSSIMGLIRVTREDWTVFQELIVALGRRDWSLAPTHGDLYVNNLLQLTDGTIVITDWDRFEQLGPYGIDAIHAYIRNLMYRTKVSWPVAIEQIMKRLRNNMSGQESMYGIIVDREFMALYILDRLEKDISGYPHYSYIGEPWRSQANYLLNQMSKWFEY